MLPYFFLVIFIILWALIPLLADQIKEFLRIAPSVFDSIRSWTVDALDKLDTIRGLDVEAIKDKIFSIEDIIKLSNGVVPADKAFSMLTDQDRVVTTSITHEVFERKNNALKNCHLSFSELQMRYEQQLETSENITR